MDANNRTIKYIKKLDIAPESELGQSLLKLDSVYGEIEKIDKQFEYLKDKKKQLIEDAEMMEMLLMHKFNKDTRMAKWDSEKY